MTAGQFANDARYQIPKGVPAKNRRYRATSSVFAEAPISRKFAVVQARLLTADEPVRTVLADGTVETERVVPAGDYVITNPGGEEYAISSEKFGGRYEETDAGYRARGTVKAVVSPVSGPITIIAPWGEEQHGQAGCIVAAVCDEAGAVTGDRYIIGAQEYMDTYAVDAPAAR